MQNRPAGEKPILGPYWVSELLQRLWELNTQTFKNIFCPWSPADTGEAQNTCLFRGAGLALQLLKVAHVGPASGPVQHVPAPSSKWKEAFWFVWTAAQYGSAESCSAVKVLLRAVGPHPLCPYIYFRHEDGREDDYVCWKCEVLAQNNSSQIQKHIFCHDSTLHADESSEKFYTLESGERNSSKLYV